MKYTSELTIDLAREKVIELFDSSENLVKWQKGLLVFKNISGEPGTVGAKSELYYKMGNREITMIETITHRNLPEEFHGTYDAGSVFNIQRNFFKEIDANHTRWITESEFKFKGIGKLFFPLMKSSFKKQTKQFMLDFKAFAEAEA